MVLASFASSPLELRSVSDLMSLAESLGMTPLEAKNSLITSFNKIKENASKREEISEGIKIFKK